MTELLHEIDGLVSNGWIESDAVRTIAAKYDVFDVELALALLDRYCSEVVSKERIYGV